jgi:hypothetical protein
MYDQMQQEQYEQQQMDDQDIVDIPGTHPDGMYENMGGPEEDDEEYMEQPEEILPEDEEAEGPEEDPIHVYFKFKFIRIKSTRSSLYAKRIMLFMEILISHQMMQHFTRTLQILQIMQVICQWFSGEDHKKSLTIHACLGMELNQGM